MSVLNVFPEVRQFVCFAAAHDGHLCFVWQPRESAPLLHADMLSRLEDSCDVFLLNPTLQLECSGWYDRAYLGYSGFMPTLLCVHGRQSTGTRQICAHYRAQLVDCCSHMQFAQARWC